MLREFRQRAVDRDDAPLGVVREVDGRLARDQPALFVHHVPRLLLAPVFRELEEGPVKFVLGRDELRERRHADHALDEPPVLPPEGRPVEGVPQKADRNQGEPPAREVEKERIRAVDRDHVLRGVGSNSFLLNLDRKSTRLNSSHGYISYAVFCLKKKKKKPKTAKHTYSNHTSAH